MVNFAQNRMEDMMKLTQLTAAVLLTAGLNTGLVGPAQASVTLCWGTCDDVPPDAPQPITPPVSVNVQPSIIQVQPFLSEDGAWNYIFGTFIPGTITSVTLPDVGGWDLGAAFPSDTWTQQVQQAVAGQPTGLVVWTLRTDHNGDISSPLFSLRSLYAPTATTLSFRDASGQVFERELSMPLTPDAIQAGYSLAALPVAVPEPSAALLFALGAGGLAALRRRQAVKQD